ncbi:MULTISPECIES: GNAT family N-acetyltransferase [unclassified Bradyrhizobium]|uniref:GNAT family N-acetyltransferase n=1 Tax=unclassified Bradyrhizobium TaxID=2631580 RepID=UPI0028E36FFD|nr:MULTISPECIES: GNAT family N-acetyltransferase [unclassified Bradyrhizobium]
MTSDAASFVAFSGDHLDAATRLSQQARWPHRREDWQMALALSKGCVAIAADGRVIGTVLMTPYGTDAGTINMVIVDEAERGKGLGRRLMQQAMTLAGDRRLQLVATEDGLPLYEKLGFHRTGEIVQHQGHLAQAVARTDAVRAAPPEDVSAMTALDAAAFGADRSDLIAHIASVGEFAVLERQGQLTGFAVLRRFGRGLVIGPVVASDLDDAKALVAHFLAGREGEFIRVDTGIESGLTPWLSSLGLGHVGGGIVMHRPAAQDRAQPSPTSFALASQAFG